jgi:hypothetical protein
MILPQRTRKIMGSVLPFGKVLETADKLSLEEQEAFMEIIRRRVIQFQGTEAIFLETVRTHEEIY